MKFEDPERCEAYRCKDFYCEMFDGDRESCIQQQCDTCRYGRSCSRCETDCQDAVENMKMQRNRR